MTCAKGPQEFFLFECEVSVAMGASLARLHGRSLKLLSFTRFRFIKGACEEDFWKAVGPEIRELVYILNFCKGAEDRWSGITRHCGNLSVLRYQPFDHTVDWFRASTDTLEASCGPDPNLLNLDSPSEMWYRSLDNNLPTPYAATEERQTVEGHPIA